MRKRKPDMDINLDATLKHFEKMAKSCEFPLLYNRRICGRFGLYLRLLVAVIVCCFVCNIRYIYDLIDTQRYDDTSDSWPRNADDDYHYHADELSILQAFNYSETGLKAIQRAKTESCRYDLMRIAYQIERTPEALFPSRMHRSCQLDDPGRFGRFVGCFADDVNNRLLRDAQYDLKETNSIENCIFHCVRLGHTLAGVQYSHECFCGSKLTRNTEPDSTPICGGFKCPGNPNQSCGGYKRMAVYETGVRKGAPIKPTRDGIHETSEGARVAFLLQLNGRSVRQVRRMIKLIYRKKHFYYVHVDSRQKYMYREMLALEKVLPNFKLKRRRFATMWGGTSLLTMLLDSFKDLLEEFHSWSWDYVINLSEADMPLVSVSVFEKVLRKYDGINFLRSHGTDTRRFIRKQGLDKVFYQCDDHMFRVGDRQLPNGIRFDGGSDWFVLHRSFIEYILQRRSEKHSLVAGLLQFYQTALLPAESFFHTLALNSEFCQRVADANMKLTNWRRSQGCKCQYKRIVDWCGCSPNVFRETDWPRLKQPDILSRLHLFGRKFDPIIDQTIIERVETQILADSLAIETDRNAFANGLVKTPAYRSYWQNDFDDRDESTDELRRRNFPKWLLLQSLSRSSLRRISADRWTAGLQLDDVQQLHVYLEHQKPLALLVKFNGTCTASTGVKRWSLEAYVKRKITTKIYHENDTLAAGLLQLEVGTDFDLKEEVFNNYGGAMTTNSNVGVIHRWNVLVLQRLGLQNKIVHLTLLDSSLSVRGDYEQKLQSPTGVEHSVLTGISKLEQGQYFIRMSMEDNRIIAETSFALLSSDNDGSADALANVDELLKLFYTIEHICLVSTENSGGTEAVEGACEISRFQFSADIGQINGASMSLIPKCREAYWSSLAPDPKSEIVGVDEKSDTVLPSLI